MNNNSLAEDFNAGKTNNNMNNNIENFKKLISDDKSSWLQKAQWRKENKAWLDKSFKIAVRILSEIRRQKPINGMTQKKLAEEMGVTPQYINKVVKGKENLRLETISKIEHVLGITLMQIAPSAFGIDVNTEKQTVNNKVDKNTAVEFAAKKIEMKSDYTYATGTNG